MAITIPTSASLGAFSTEIATNKATQGDYDPRVANAVVTLATETSAALLTSQAVIPVNLASGILAAGTPLAAWADDAASAPGITLADSKCVGIRWNNNGTQVAVWLSADMPQDLDDTAPVVLHLLASKVGATVGDATTFVVTAFFQTVAALHDADTDCGGSTSAMVGNATSKTVAELTLTIAAVDVPPAPAKLSFSIKPASLGADDVIVSSAWFEYTRKALAS